MALFPPPPLPVNDSLREQPPAHVVVVPVRDVQWGRRVFRAPDFDLPDPGHFASISKKALDARFKNKFAKNSAKQKI